MENTIADTNPVIEKTVTTPQGGTPPPVTSKAATPTGIEPTKEPVKATEPPKEPEKKEEPKPTTQEDYAAKLAALTKKESYITKREKELKEKEAKLTPLEKSIQEKSILKTFESMGLTFEQGMDLAIKELSGSKEPDVNDKIKALEQKLIDKEKKEQEAVEATKVQERQAAFTKFVDETTKEVQSKPEFAFTNTLKRHDLVVDVMNEYYNKNKEMTTVEEAAKRVEEHLENEMKSFIPELMKSDKFKALLAQFQATEEPKKETTTPAPAVKKEVVTLSNKMAPANASFDTRSMSREESKKRAASMIVWKD